MLKTCADTIGGKDNHFETQAMATASDLVSANNDPRGRDRARTHTQNSTGQKMTNGIFGFPSANG